MADKLTKVEISFDGSTYTDVTDYCKGWVYNGTLDNIADTISIKFKKDFKDTYTLSEWLYIKVYEGWTTSTDRFVFWGVITRVVDQYDYLVVDGADKTYFLIKDKQTAVYNSTDAFGGVISAIAQNMIESANLTAIVETTDSSTNLNQFIVSDTTDALERLTVLAKQVDYLILYDPDVDSIYFVSRGYFINTNVLNIPNDITERPKWDEDATRLFNDLTLKGGTTSGVRTQLFNGDGSNLEFEVDLTPSDSVSVEENIAGTWTLQTQGTPGVSATYDYSIDKVNKKIIYKAGNAPAAGTNNVRITISAQIPPTVQVTEPTSISIYNKGIDASGGAIPIRETIILDDITTVDDAFKKADKILSLFAYPFYSTSVPIKASVDITRNYKLGDSISVTDSNVGFTQRTFIITEIVREWPGSGAKITLGDKAYRLGQYESLIESRIKRLENLLSGDYEVLNASRNFNHTLNVSITSATYQEECINDSFILGHPVNGLIGMGIILDDFESGWTGNWIGSGFTLSNDTTNYLTGSQSGTLAFVSSGTKTITSSQSYGDLSTYTGVSTGTPSQGTIGLWLKNGANTITSVKLKIGSDSSNYAYYTGSIYQNALSFTWQGTTTFTYLTFDLNVPDSVTGTPNWADCDYTVIEIVVSNSSGTLNIDYLTISSSNYIGLNGLGSRLTYKSAVTIV